MGDFRQTCPVIFQGTKAQVIDVSIKSSPLWPQFKVHTLTQPIHNLANLEFTLFVDTIGDGAGPDICLDGMLDIVTNPEDLMSFVYPMEIPLNVSNVLFSAQQIFRLTSIITHS